MINTLFKFAGKQITHHIIHLIKFIRWSDDEAGIESLRYGGDSAAVSLQLNQQYQIIEWKWMNANIVIDEYIHQRAISSSNFHIPMIIDQYKKQCVFLFFFFKFWLS